MKNFIYALAFISLLGACGHSSDKKGELDKLRLQQEKIANKISQLENELGANDTQREVKSIAVKVEPVTGCVFTHYLEVQGVVDGDQNVAVSPQSSGIVTAVYVTEGSNVRKGEVLAELDANVLKKSLAELKTQLNFATNMFEKQKALWDKNIGSEIQYLQAKTNKEALEDKIKTLQGQIDLSRVVSPISGTVERVPLKVGEMASPGLPTSTIRVINMNSAKIEAAISESYSSSIQKGSRVMVRFPDLDKEIESTIGFVSRFIDPTNRTFQVECKIKSDDVVLRANMIAYLKIKDYTNERAVCLPVNFVQKSSDGNYVYVAEQKGSQWMATRRSVETGMDYNGTIEILKGLNEGDKVISSGYQNLTEGAIINF